MSDKRKSFAADGIIVSAIDTHTTIETTYGFAVLKNTEILAWNIARDEDDAEYILEIVTKDKEFHLGFQFRKKGDQIKTVAHDFTQFMKTIALI